MTKNAGLVKKPISRKMTAVRLPTEDIPGNPRSTFIKNKSRTIRPQSCLSVRTAKKSDKKVIFKVKNATQRQEIKKAFKEMLFGNKLMNNELQDKINYFYRPYNRKAAAGVPMPLTYHDDFMADEEAQKLEQVYSDKARDKWHRVSSQILSSEK